MSETEPDEDVYAVDCDIKFREAPAFVQVKCTSTRTIGGRSVSVQVEPHWRDAWSNLKLPLYLLVVIVPKSTATWIRNDANGTFHATAAFWQRVDPLNIPRSIRVPKSQRLGVDTMTKWHSDVLACFEPKSVA